MSALERSLATTRSLARPTRVGAAWFVLWVQIAAIGIMAALPVVVNPWGSDAYINAKVFVLLGLTAAMVLGWGIVYLGARSPRWTVTIPEIPLWAYALFVLLSSAVSVSPLPTLFGVPWRYEGLLAILSYVVLYFVGVHFFESESRFRALVTAASSAALLAGTYGILQLFLRPLFPGEALIRLWYDIGAPRIGSLIGSPVEFGGYLCLVTPLMLALGLAITGRIRTVFLAGAAVGFTASVMTLTRAAWLGMAAGTLVFAAAAGGPVLRRYWKELATVGAATAIVLAGLVTAFVTPERMASRAASSLAVGSGSAGQRLYIWEGTVDLIRQRPLLGWGLETLGFVFPYNLPSQVRHFGPAPIIIDRAHNDVLHVAVSIGIPGALAYMGFWALAVLAAIRIWRRATGATRIVAAGWLAALVGYLIQAQFSFSTVAFTPLVWLLAGSAGGWESTSRDPGPSNPQAPLGDQAAR